MHNNLYKYALFAVLAGWIFTAIGFYWRNPAYAMDWSMTTAIGTMGAAAVSPWLAEPDDRKRREEAMFVSRMTRCRNGIAAQIALFDHAGLSELSQRVQV